MTHNVIDLFAGVGGLSEGFRSQGFDVTLANEWDLSIAQAYTANHPETMMLVEDITKLKVTEVFRPFRDRTAVVVGGPPCQGFSQKGQRRSINDERNYLFRYFVNVVNYVRPPMFVMENVPNLLTSEGGLFKREIEELFGSLGYAVVASILNAADFGVPQHRRRAIIIGALAPYQAALPSPISSRTTVWDAISDLSYLKSGQGEEISDYRMEARSTYQRHLRTNSHVLYNHRATRHSPVALERLAMIPPGGGKEHLPQEHRTKSIYSGTWTRMSPDEQSVTITTRFDTPSSGKFTHPYLDRAITVREAARIQSFPDTFRFLGTKTSQMKQVGNAVPPILAGAIAKEVRNSFK